MPSLQSFSSRIWFFAADCRIGTIVFRRHARRIAAVLLLTPLAALRAQDGEMQWRYTVAQRGGISLSAPALTPDGATVYVGATDRSLGRLLAISREGGPKWVFEKPGFIDASPALAADGTIYIGHGFGKLYALTPGANSVTVKWESNLGLKITSSAAIGQDGTIYVGADRQLHAVAPQDGEVLWSVPTQGEVESSPAIAADGTIYFGSYDQKVYARNRDGSEKWTFVTGGAVLASPAIGADGTVYIGSADQSIYAISPEGNKKWEYPTNGSIQASPVIGADGTIYVVADTSVYALRPNETDERLRWKAAITPPAGSISTPAIRADGTIIFGADDGRVRALNPQDGSQKWAFNTETNDLIESSPIISPDGSIYIGSFPYLFKLNGNGSPLSAYSSWPAFRRDIRHTGRALATNTGGQLVNISTRAQAGAGRNLIAGFVVQAPQGRAYLIRGVGPGLQANNVAGFLPDPGLQVFSGALPFRTNDNWFLNDESNQLSLSETTAAVGAFPLQPGSADAAILPALPSGVYHAHTNSSDARSGVALVEVYDGLAGDPTARLLNLSTRAFVGTGENILIAGFVVGGAGSMRLLLRGIGPGLAQFGVGGVLAQPRLTVFRGGTEIARNTGWTSNGYRNDLMVAAAAVSAFALDERNPDSALLFDAEPGAYTIQISGVGNTTGEAMVEIYVLP